jgi:hypothetical protein
MTGQISEAERRQPGWIGRDERTGVSIRGRARRAGATELDVIIHDMSLEGCRLECEHEALQIGEWLDLEVAGLEGLRGQVRWSLLGSAGLQFQK